jgi:hypothetical protein
MVGMGTLLSWEIGSVRLCSSMNRTLAHGKNIGSAQHPWNIVTTLISSKS